MTTRPWVAASLCIAASWTTSAQGPGTFYVNCATGNNSAAGGIDTPWRTVQKAASTLTAGQTALVRGGTCAENDIQFSNNGTSGNPITIAGYPGETAVIDGGFTTTGTLEAVFTINASDYITLDNLTITRGRGANIWVGEDAPALNFSLTNSIVTNVVTMDNAALVRLDKATNFLVHNNSIHGLVNGGDSNAVGNGIVLFQSVNGDITNNEIYDIKNGGNFGNGIYHKHSTSYALSGVSTIANNYIHDVNNRCVVLSAHKYTVRNNLLKNCPEAGILLFESAGTCGAQGNTLDHNTIVDSPRGIILTRPDSGGGCDGAEDTVVKNNLVDRCTSGEYRCLSVWKYVSGDKDASNTSAYNNNLYSTTLGATVVNVTTGNYTVLTMPLTKSGNISSAPVYVNGSGGNYTLAATSPGKAGGNDGLDMGLSDFSAVGIDNVVDPPPSGSPPGVFTLKGALGPTH